MTSGNTATPALQPRPGVPNVYAEVLAEYAASLDRTPLAPASRAKYLGRARGYLSWLASAEVQGHPLDDAAARDWAVRDYRRWLKVVRKAAPSTINNTLAALDDFYTRRGLGPAGARREDPPARTAPRALDSQQARRFLRVVEQEPSLRNRLTALLPYYAGLRIGEVVGLDIDDVALSARKGEIRVMGKGRDGGKLWPCPYMASFGLSCRPG